MLTSYHLRRAILWASIAISFGSDIAVAVPTTTPVVIEDTQRLNALNTALKNNPFDVQIYIQRGLLYDRLEDDLAAIYDYTEVIRLAPNNVIAYNNRAVARLHRRDYWGAYLDYTQLVKIQPNQPKIHTSRAIVRQQLGDCKGAIADLRIAAILFYQQGDRVNYQKTLVNLKHFQRLSRNNAQILITH